MPDPALKHEIIPEMPTVVREAFDSWPDRARDRAEELRAMIFETAAETGVGPLTETLKWGQPSYLTEASKSGTTVRLGYAEGEAEPCRLYVHCATNLVDRYREQFPELSYQGNRAIQFDETDTLPDVPVRRCIAMALTYHRDKKGR